MKNLFRSRKDAILIITMMTATFFFAARVIMTGYDLFSVLLAGSGWDFIQSREMFQFLEWLFPLLGLLSLLAVQIIRTAKKLYLILFLFVTTIAGSIITLQSEAIGIEKHGWRTLGAARLAIVVECVIFPIFVLVLIFSGRKRRPRTMK